MTIACNAGEFINAIIGRKIIDCEIVDQFDPDATRVPVIFTLEEKDGQPDCVIVEMEYRYAVQFDTYLDEHGSPIGHQGEIIGALLCTKEDAETFSEHENEYRWVANCKTGREASKGDIPKDF